MPTTTKPSSLIRIARDVKSESEVTKQKLIGKLKLHRMLAIAIIEQFKGREKLLLTATRKAVLTCSGTSILGALVSRHPMQTLVLSAAAEHVQASGDGAKSFVLMLDAALREVERQLLTRPCAHQAAWLMRLSHATRWLQQVHLLCKAT